jgi:hypothetical protein
MIHLFGLAAVFLFAACSNRKEPSKELPSPSLPLDLSETDPLPGVKANLEEVRRQLNAAGISDEQIDLGKPGTIDEADLLLTTVDSYVRDPGNEKLKNIVTGPFKQISQAYFNQGLTEHEVFGPCSNINAFNKALAYNPDHQKANYYYGYCAGDTESLRWALALDPTDKQAWEALSRLFVAQGLLAEAEEATVEWLRLDLGNFDAAKQLALIYTTEGALDMAEKAWKYTIELHPLNAESHSALGFILLLQGNQENAEKEFFSAGILDVGINVSLIHFFTTTGSWKAAKRHLVLLSSQVPQLRQEIQQLLRDINQQQKSIKPKAAPPLKIDRVIPV